jgi:exopolyphosphatase/guanosine-5'-triphosphate,3'-diphosphate pyrophosphatase
LDIKNYAAIDIGSNAVRMLVKTITKAERKDPFFKKTSLVRVPIRLGEDVFVGGKIGETKQKRMLEAMKAYQLLMQAHGIDRYKACATSAMRDAENGGEFAEKIKKETGIEIEIIDGEHEAAYIATTDLRSLIQDERSYLYVDVGGGSTEFTLFSNGKTAASRSFKLGTVRLLNDLVKDELWQEVEEWVKKTTTNYKGLDMIGSGGNINHIFKSSAKKKGTPLSLNYLSSYFQLIESLTYEERIAQLNMKLDRADVIIPATKIYLSAMKWSKSKRIFVPKIGLADGIIKAMYNEFES